MNLSLCILQQQYFCITTLYILIKNLSTHYCNAAIIALNQPSPVSSLITTNQVDTDVKNYDHSKSFLTPRKHNHSTPEIHYTNTTSTQVQPNVHPCLCPYIPSNPTTPLKLPTYIKELICFKIGNEMTIQYNFTNKGR